LAELDSSLRDVALLHESSQMILSGGDLDTVLHQILLIVRSYFSVVNCAVFLLDQNSAELYCRARNGYPDPRPKYRIGIDGIVGWAAKAKQPVSVPDVYQEPRYILGDPKVQSELALPLLVRGDLLGVLDVESDQLRFFSPQIVQVLSIFAGQAAIALDSARLHQTERHRMHQIELINLIARSATAAQHTRDLLLNICELISDAFDGADVAILIAQSDGGLALQARAGSRRPERQHLSPIQRVALLPDGFLAFAGLPREKAPGCYGENSGEAFVPLVTCGEMLGGIVLAPADGKEIGEEDLAIAQAASDVCATAIKNVQLSEELHRVANTDFLTGTHNQRYFHAAMEMEIMRARRYQKPLTVAMLDLLNFRQVNETVGYDGGDQFLRDLARNIQVRIRSNDIMCRYTGDRFAFIFPETDTHNSHAVLQKLQAAVASMTFQLGEQDRKIEAAIATVYFPQEGSTSGEIIRLLLTRIQCEKQRAANASA
jgi:diguanylate cyclase (GGDEF)-like protein